MRICDGGALHGDGLVLLGLRLATGDLYPAKWNIVGGHAVPGETVDKLWFASFEEELGVRPVRFECLGVWPEPAAERHGEAQYHLFVVHE